MNARKFVSSLGARVRLWPVPRRMRTDGLELPRKNDDWIVEQVDPRGVVRLRNVRTDHVALLGNDRIHHFDHEPHRDWDGLKHGLLVLHTQLVLSGPNVFYLPQPFRAH